MYRAQEFMTALILVSILAVIENKGMESSPHVAVYVSKMRKGYLEIDYSSGYLDMLSAELREKNPGKKITINDILDYARRTPEVNNAVIKVKEQYAREAREHS